MGKVCALIPLFLLLAMNAFAQSLTIDKLERNPIAQASKDVAFSALVEGTVSDPQLQVFVFVFQPQLGGWRPYLATTDYIPEGNGQYRWRAICQFGELNGKGVGATYQIRAMVFNQATVHAGLSAAAVDHALKTEVVVLKRVK